MTLMTLQPFWSAATADFLCFPMLPAASPVEAVTGEDIGEDLSQLMGAKVQEEVALPRARHSQAGQPAGRTSGWTSQYLRVKLFWQIFWMCLNQMKPHPDCINIWNHLLVDYIYNHDIHIYIYVYTPIYPYTCLSHVCIKLYYRTIIYTWLHI